MPSDLCLIPHAAEGHPDKFPVGRPGNRLTQGRFPDTWRPHETQYRPLKFLHPLLHREVLQDSLFYILQPVVVILQNSFCPRQVTAYLTSLFPRNV